jgi:hypothetical protein
MGQLQTGELTGAEIPCTRRNTVDLSHNHLTFIVEKPSSLSVRQGRIPPALAFVVVDERCLVQRSCGGDLRAYRDY